MIADMWRFFAKMEKELKTHKLHILITPSQHEKLKLYAEAKQSSIGNLLRQYVDQLPVTIKSS